jgi:hypothetical protein
MVGGRVSRETCKIQSREGPIVAETKDDIAQERDRLRAENETLRAQLTAAGAPRVVAPTQTFVLSEGDRQELAARGVLNVGGRMRTRDEVRAMLGDKQREVDLGTVEPDAGTLSTLAQQRKQGATPGVDYVWPSVAPGQIDPAVAGRPGISGPSADEVDDEHEGE